MSENTENTESLLQEEKEEDLHPTLEQIDFYTLLMEQMGI